MTFSKSNYYKKFIPIALAVFGLSQLASFAKLEQVMLPINTDNKKITFTFYHFDASKTATLTEIKESIGDTVIQAKASAAVSASNQSNFSYNSGKFTFTKDTSYIIQKGTITSATKSPRVQKHTLILTDDEGRHAIAYTPNVSSAELGYALIKFLASSKTKFTTAVIIDSGNQCGFYMTNGKYNPYYLKELKKPANALIVK